MSRTGRLLIISGLSGAGKGTITKRLLEKYPEDYVLSVSATTRKPRPGEIDGTDYFFKTEEEFERMIAGGGFLEYAQYVNNYYGTPKAWVEKQLASGKNVILEIDVQGAFQVKAVIPDTVLVFVVAPTPEELRRRIITRGGVGEEELAQRLARAEEEIKFKDRYDFVIVNRDVEKSVEMLHNIQRSLNEEKFTGEKNMLHPSYTDLMDAVNSEVPEGGEPIVHSRYSIVMAAAKRARQIVDGSDPLVEADDTEKPLSIAIEELYTHKVKILSEDAEEEDEITFSGEEDEPFAEDAAFIGDEEIISDENQE